MEKSKAVQELQDYLHNQKYIDEKQENIEILEARIMKMTASYSDMPRGGTGASKEDLIIKKIELEQEVYTYLNDLIDQNKLINKAIRELEQPYRNILDFRYLCGMPLVEVAAKENYSYRQCKNKLKKAFELYAEKRG